MGSTLLVIANRIAPRLDLALYSNVATAKSGIHKAVIDSLIDVIQNIYNKMAWEFLDDEDTTLSTTSGTREYTLPSDVDPNKIIQIDLLNHGTAASADEAKTLVLSKMNSGDFFDLYPGNISASASLNRPDTWTYFNGKIILNPTPDDNPDNSNNDYTLRIRFKNIVSHFTIANATTFSIPERYENVLTFGVLKELHERSSHYQDRYDDVLADMLNNESLGVNIRLGQKKGISKGFSNHRSYNRYF